MKTTHTPKFQKGTPTILNNLAPHRESNTPPGSYTSSHGLKSNHAKHQRLQETFLKIPQVMHPLAHHGNHPKMHSKHKIPLLELLTRRRNGHLSRMVYRLLPTVISQLGHTLLTIFQHKISFLGLLTRRRNGHLPRAIPEFLGVPGQKNFGPPKI